MSALLKQIFDGIFTCKDKSRKLTRKNLPRNSLQHCVRVERALPPFCPWVLSPVKCNKEVAGGGGAGCGHSPQRAWALGLSLVSGKEPCYLGASEERVLSPLWDNPFPDCVDVAAETSPCAPYLPTEGSPCQVLLDWFLPPGCLWWPLSLNFFQSWKM